jgi:aminoacrylate hydrolase
VPTVSIGDAELWYEISGEGAPLLLVPGLSGLGAFWARQVAELSRDFQTVIHDHRGTGRSTHSLIRYSVEQMADDVLRLMDALGIESAHYVGHSTGGAMGQVLATEHPERIRSLVLSATWAGHAPYFQRLFASRRQTLLESGVEAYLRASVLVQAPPWWISANDAEITARQQALAAEAAPVEVTASRIDAILRFDRRARLRDVRIPTLVIVAADDTITPRFYSEEIAAGIPGARLVVLETGGHIAPQVAADAWNAAVGAFLRAQQTAVIT